MVNKDFSGNIIMLYLVQKIGNVIIQQNSELEPFGQAIFITQMNTKKKRIITISN